MSRPTNREMCEELVDNSACLRTGDEQFIHRLWDAADFDDLNGYDENRLRGIYNELFNAGLNG